MEILNLRSCRHIVAIAVNNRKVKNVIMTVAIKGRDKINKLIIARKTVILIQKDCIRKDTVCILNRALSLLGNCCTLSRLIDRNLFVTALNV